MSKTGDWTLNITNHADDFPARVLLTKSDKSGESAIYVQLHTAEAKIVSNGITGHCECGECDTPINPYDSFCRHCGARLTGGW